MSRGPTYPEFVVKNSREWSELSTKLIRYHRAKVTFEGMWVAWYEYSQVHRTDGPAIIWSSGRREYALNGRYLTFKDWAARTSKLGQALYGHDEIGD